MVHKKVMQVLDVIGILQKNLRCWLVQPIISTWRWTCMSWHAVDDLQLEKSRTLTPCPGKPPTPKGNWPKPCQVDKVHCLHGSLKTICQIPVQFQVKNPCAMSINFKFNDISHTCSKCSPTMRPARSASEPVDCRVKNKRETLRPKHLPAAQTLAGNASKICGFNT